MKKTIIINSEFFGRGPEELGEKVMGSFLRKLCLEERKPEKILFYSSGVKLLADDSPVHDAMKVLEKAGVDLVACVTCVNYFNLGDKIHSGRIGDMVEIISAMMNSDNVITV